MYCTCHRDLIVECLDDNDDSIRLRALDLISGMVSSKNLVEIVRKLMTHMDTSESAGKREIVCVWVGSQGKCRRERGRCPVLPRQPFLRHPQEFLRYFELSYDAPSEGTDSTVLILEYLVSQVLGTILGCP